MAESGEPMLAVAQSLADEMRRHADRSSHAHKMPADGNGAITGDDSLFPRDGDLKTREDRRVALLDTYVCPVRLVSGDVFHVLFVIPR